MNVHVSRPTASELRLEFKTDAADALIPVPNVWFRYERASQVAPLRICLLAYLLARPFIGNSFRFSKLPIPAHLASRIQKDFEADEFFIGPVTNIPSQILPDFCYEAIATDAASSGENDLICTRNELGYCLTAARNDESPLLRISTNVDLLTGFTEHPALLSLISVYLCAYDALGVRCLRVRPQPESGEWLDRTRLLLAEVGGALAEPSG